MDTVAAKINSELDLVYETVIRVCLPLVLSLLFTGSVSAATPEEWEKIKALIIFGQPGNLEKGVAALAKFAVDELQIKDMTIDEGSGISRENRVSADQMMRVLAKFEPHRTLMRRQGREYYKTGTLNGINTRAGCIASSNGGLYRYVVMINTPGKSIKPVMRKLLESLD